MVEHIVSAIAPQLRHWRAHSIPFLLMIDGNSIRSAELDSWSHSAAAHEQSLINQLLGLGCLDVWRLLFPNITGYTYFGDQGEASRIDYFLTEGSPALVPCGCAIL